MQATVASAQATLNKLDGETAALVRDLGGFAKFLLHAGGRDFYRAVGELDLSISQIRTLHLLVGEMDEASIKSLADEIGLSVPAISRSIDSLVQRGLVTRVESTDDRRAKTVRATAEARALVDRLIELRVAGIADFVGTLKPAERAALARALRPIVAREEIAPMCVATPTPRKPKTQKDASHA